MIRLAFKNLLQERTRLLVSVSGVAAAFFIILLMGGVFEGLSGQLVSYLEQSDADVWVMQAGVSNMHMSTSVLPSALEEPLKRVPGVAAVTPILYASNPVQIKEKRWFSYIVGLKQGSQRGGPWSMKEGNSSPSPGEAEDILSAPGVASYFLVKAQSEVSPSTLAERIQQTVPGVNAMTRDAFVASDRDMTLQMGVDLIQVMSFIGLVIGLLVIGLTIYTATLRRAREYGIAKALGANNHQLFIAVAIQSLTIAVLALGVAIAIAYLVRPLIDVLVPEVPLVYPLESFVKLAVASLAVAGLAALLPAYRIAQIEPATVFKE